MAKLASILPKECKPIICTDAGLKVPWFKAIDKHDWYWLGRVRGTIFCKFNNKNSWALINNQHHKAKTKASELPACLLSKAPWFLVTNLPNETFLPHQLVALYQRRMTIEEMFRDNKNEYYGLGLSRSRTRDIPRLENILLIAMIAQISLYIVGKAAEMNGYHRHFQANTEKRRVLSYSYLALRILKHNGVKYRINRRMLQVALNELSKESYG